MRKALRALVLPVALAALVALCVFAPARAFAEEATYRLPVFETSDLHGYLVETSGDVFEFRLARIADAVNDVRGAGGTYRSETAILLDGGDIYQGNTLSNLLDGWPMSAYLDLMDYDAVTIGNHEFDWGIDNVVDDDATVMDYAYDGIATVNDVPVVMSNLYRDGAPVTFTRPYVILEKTALGPDGREIAVRVAVIGFALDYAEAIKTSKFAGLGYEIIEDFAAVDALAAQLEADGTCDATILLVHASAPDVAARLAPGTAVDLVVGGHSHKNRSGATSAGVAYMQPTNYAQAYCHAELVFALDAAGKPLFQAVEGAGFVSVVDDRSLLYDTEANAGNLDGTVVALSDVAIDAIAEALTQTVGYITESAEKRPEGTSKRCSPCGTWMCTIMARAVDAQVGFINGGGVRTGFPLEDGAPFRNITVSDVYTMFPFGNRICGLELTWEEVLELLTYSLADKETRSLITVVSGLDCYFTDTEVNAIACDGRTIYANGTWYASPQERVRVAVSDYLTTSDVVVDGKSNPLIAWAASDRLVEVAEVDSEAALEVLRAEAAAGDGHLAVDGATHYVEGEYVVPAVEPEPAPAPEPTPAPEPESEPAPAPAPAPSPEPAPAEQTNWVLIAAVGAGVVAAAALVIWAIRRKRPREESEESCR